MTSAPTDSTGAARARVADAPSANWVDAHAPESLRPYLHLARADRPIGTWLLLLPCWHGLSLALASGPHALSPWRVAWMAALFVIGSFVMRGAGCALNDIVDRDIDAKVARTRSRPLPSGRISLAQAVATMIGLALVGLAVLVQFNWPTVVWGVASLALVAIYPFMKRVTWWPQLFLGLAFNWGALIGWIAVTAEIAWPAALVYFGAICWTLGYDTIYAHQDKEDDALIGVHSTARLFGERTGPWLAGFYGGAVLFWLAAGVAGGLGLGFFVGLIAVAFHFAWQVRALDIHDGAACLGLFRSNRDCGLLLLAAIALGAVG